MPVGRETNESTQNVRPDFFGWDWCGCARICFGVAETLASMAAVHPDIKTYNDAQAPVDREICHLLAQEIDRHLPEAENKIWHAHPVWFQEDNPVVGYSKLKGCVRLLFWSGQSFDEDGLEKEGTFKAAEARFTSVDQVNPTDLARWLAKARTIQWDYKNLIRRKGRLERLK
jgi:hypothetical protein